MATLGNVASDGVTLFFDKYVKNNPKWSTSMKFVLSEDTPIFKVEENELKETKLEVLSGERVNIMSKSLKILGKDKYVKIKTSDNFQGYLDILSIYKPVGIDAFEPKEMSISELTKNVKDSRSPIKISTKGTLQGLEKVYSADNVIGVSLIGGTSTADFSFVNRYGVPVFWVKREKTHHHFKKYHDISRGAGTSIYQHQEIKDFLNDITQYIDEEYSGLKENEQEDAFAFYNEYIPQLIGRLCPTRDKDCIRNIPIKTIKDNVVGAFYSAGFVKAGDQVQKMSVSVFKGWLRRPSFNKGKPIPNTGTLPASLMKSIKDPVLKRMFLYGLKIKNPKYGENNVQLVGMGNPILKIIDDYNDEYELSFSGGMSTNEDFNAVDDDHTPVLFAKSQNGKGFIYGGRKWHGASVSVVPVGLIKSMSQQQILNLDMRG